MYGDAVPGDTSLEKRQKHAGLWVVFHLCFCPMFVARIDTARRREKAFRESRLRQKKTHSSKKQARKGDY